MDAYSAAAIKVGPCSLQGSRVGSYGGQVILPLAHTIEHEEVVVLQNLKYNYEEFLNSVCSNLLVGILTSFWKS